MPKIRKRSNKGQELTQPDEFLTLSEKVADYVMLNTKQVLAGVGIVVAVIAIASGIYYWKEAGKNKAAHLFFQASKQMQAAESQADAAKAEPELAAARTIYENIVKEYGSSSLVPAAHYQLGNIDARLSKWDDALKHYHEAVTKDGNSIIATAAKQKVAYVKWAKGDKEGALKDFDLLLAAPGSAKDLIHVEKGKLLEELGKKEDALKEYNAVIADFKESPFLGDATRRYVALGGQPPQASASTPKEAVTVEVKPQSPASPEKK